MNDFQIINHFSNHYELTRYLFSNVFYHFNFEQFQKHYIFNDTSFFVLFCFDTSYKINKSNRNLKYKI